MVDANGKNPLLAPERFTNLTKSQISALLKADEIARTWEHNKSSFKIDLEAIRSLMRDNGLVFDVCEMLGYARWAEAQENSGLADVWYGFAAEAGDLRPSNVPVTASVLPVSTADTDPEPAIVACMETSIGTGDNRALNVFGCCAVGATTPIRMTHVSESHFE